MTVANSTEKNTIVRQLFIFFCNFTTVIAVCTHKRAFRSCIAADSFVLEHRREYTNSPFLMFLMTLFKTQRVCFAGALGQFVGGRLTCLARSFTHTDP